MTSCDPSVTLRDVIPIEAAKVEVQVIGPEIYFNSDWNKARRGQRMKERAHARTHTPHTHTGIHTHTQDEGVDRVGTMSQQADNSPNGVFGHVFFFCRTCFQVLFFFFLSEQALT